MTDDALEPAEVRPGDCVNGNFHEDGVEMRPSHEGIALAYFGKRYKDLPGSDQRLVRKVYKGHVATINLDFKAAMKNNMVSAEHRLGKCTELLDKMQLLMERIVDDNMELAFEDNMEATRNPAFPKTRAGTIRRNLKHTRMTQDTVEKFIDMNLKLARQGEKGQKNVVNQTNIDNSQNVTLTPEDVQSKLNSIVSGEVVEE